MYGMDPETVDSWTVLENGDVILEGSDSDNYAVSLRFPAEEFAKAAKASDDRRRG